LLFSKNKITGKKVKNYRQRYCYRNPFSFSHVIFLNFLITLFYQITINNKIIAKFSETD